MLAVAFGALAVAACASKVDSGQGATGAPCGNGVFCADEEYCCDAKCGLCVPAEVACKDTCAM